ncbi:glycosyltransferase family 4 protein [Arthrobacter halodurans]|uniref:Glycosyltransferase family 4 protein n=1 Tax=Arthrobacter halodurans TaxID=516699 RepID=A0ABV4UNR3_9MICC
MRAPLTGDRGPRPLRVLFEGLWWFDGPDSNRQVLRDIVRAWAEAFPDDEAHLVVPRRQAERVRAEAPPAVTVHGTRFSQHGLGCLLGVGWLARRLRTDAVLTHNFPTLVGPRPTVFLHDLIFESNPEWFTRAERAYLRVISLTIGRARSVVTSSGTEAARIRRLHPGLDVTPVGLAAPSDLTGAEPRPPAGGPLPGVQLSGGPASGLRPGGFHLAVGRLNARKNLGFAIRVADAAGWITPDRPLAVVGSRSGLAEDACPVEAGGPADGTGRADGRGPVNGAGPADHRHPADGLARLRELRDRGAVVFLGRVDPGELAWLYRGALSLIYTSRDEGFGMPPVEAMAFGCPVVASDIPVLREVTGGHAAVVLPLGDEAAAAAALRAAGPEHLRAAGTAGREHALRSYAWEDTARRIRAAMVRGLGDDGAARPAPLAAGAREAGTP